MVEIVVFEDLPEAIDIYLKHNILPDEKEQLLKVIREILKESDNGVKIKRIMGRLVIEVGDKFTITVKQ